jgi:hypothetical protein
VKYYATDSQWEEGEIGECPMCHGRHFSVVDSYPINPVAEDYRKPGSLIRRSIPTVAIVCVRCGFISQHSMAAMGLLEETNHDIVENNDSKK